LDYTKFYTPPATATVLVDKLNIPKPDVVIDICCGSCNLLHAARNRWKSANLVGVDTNANLSADISIITMDGRRFATNNPNKYPLVLANPPFDCMSSSKEFPMLYCGVFERYQTKRLENEMLLANLILLRENGTLVIIMPSTFVEAESNIAIRSLLGTNYYIKNIIKLPDDTFGTTGIRSYALIIKNCTPRRRITKFSEIISCGEELKTIDVETVPQKRIAVGEWYINTCLTHNKGQYNIRRGNISSQMFSETGKMLLHTSKRCDDWKPSLRMFSTNIDNLIYAETGDIIVSRIGKSAGQWCRYEGETIPISDCLYRIKDSDGLIYKAIKGHSFDFPQKGVATRYITMNDFLSWINCIKSGKK